MNKTLRTFFIKLVALTSILIGSSFIISNIYAVIVEPDIPELEDHTHPHIEEVNFKNADDLVKSKIKADITYAQMMAEMGEGFGMIQKGILTQNKLLIKSGVYMIDAHPAPRHKPWSIMASQDQEDFKQTLLSYDKLLHGATSEILQALDEKDWIKVNEKAYMLSTHCISCHTTWQNKTIHYKLTEENTTKKGK